MCVSTLMQIHYFARYLSAVSRYRFSLLYYPVSFPYLIIKVRVIFDFRKSKLSREWNRIFFMMFSWSVFWGQTCFANTDEEGCLLCTVRHKLFLKVASWIEV